MRSDIYALHIIRYRPKALHDGHSESIWVPVMYYLRYVI